MQHKLFAFGLTLRDNTEMFFNTYFSIMFETAQKLRVQIYIAACLNFGDLINGYGVGWAGPMLPKFDNPSESPIPYTITEVEKSWIASVSYLGCFGAFAAGFLANQFGRKNSLIIGGITHLTSYAVLAFATSLTLIITGRLLVGVSLCFLTVSGIMYVGEIASPNIRGVILTSMGVSHASGSLLVYCIAPFVDFASVGYVSIGLNAVFIVACCFLPESPMFYVLKDDEASARSVLQYLGRNADINSELKTLIDKVREQRNNRYIAGSWKELLKLKCNRKSIFITVSLSSFQQCSGIIAVIFYANTIFRYAGSSIQPDIATIIVGATFVIGAVLAPVFIDKYGRRILLIVSTSGLCMTMAGLGVYFYLKSMKPSSVESVGWLPLTLLVVAQFAYSFGLSIVPNALTGELFTPKVRGLGPSLSLCSGMATGFVTIILFGYVVVAMGIHFTFWIFAICNALALLFVIFFVPETMGKSLMEIQEMLDR